MDLVAEHNRIEREAAELSDALLKLLRVEGHEGSVELMFQVVKGEPHVTRIRRHDVFTRNDLVRHFST